MSEDAIAFIVVAFGFGCLILLIGLLATAFAWDGNQVAHPGDDADQADQEAGEAP